MAWKVPWVSTMNPPSAMVMGKYSARLWLKPPITDDRRSAKNPSCKVYLRFQWSANTPAGTSKARRMTRKTMVFTTMPNGLTPMCSINSFSMALQKVIPASRFRT